MDNALLKTLYLNPIYNKDERTGRLEKERDDALFYVVANSDGTRQIRIMEKPKYKFYLAKENMNYHRFSVPREDLMEIVCEYSKRHNVMAEAVGLKNQFAFAKKDYRTKKDWIQQNLYNNSQLYLADVDMEEAFKLAYVQKYGDHAADLSYTTSFTDIEVRADLGDFEQHKAEVPICSICHVDTKTETLHVMILNDPKVPMIKEVFSDLNGFIKEFREFMNEIREECIKGIISKKGNPNSAHSFNFNYKFYLFDDEKDLIRYYFKIIDDTKPDFCGIWNINFDMIFIKNRAAKLGLNMADLTSNSTIPPKFRHFEYVEDHERFANKAAATHFSRYFDKVISTSSTQWYCQMSMHSNLRKRFLEINYKLDHIGEKYANVKKVDLDALGYEIKDVYSKNFKVFLRYAMIDPIVQFMIERVNVDIPRYMVNCRLASFFHGLKKTYAIKNELYFFMLNKKNEIIGNNKTYDIVEPLPGAIVGNPKNIIEKGEVLLGVATHIYRNVVDLDATALYPSLILVFAILKTTIYGRVVHVYQDKNIGGMNVKIPITDGSELNKMLETIDTSIFDIGTRYYGLPRFDEIITQIEKSCIK